MSIQYVPYKEIDQQKWDACVNGSHNRMIYAQSIYLDHMADHWDGLVLDDYDAVMPLCYRTKIQIAYLYQPAFIQQGGIFSRNTISESFVNDFLTKAAHHFKFAEITLNYANPIKASDVLSANMRSNYIIDLTVKYEQIQDSYTNNFKKSVRRIKKFNLSYEPYADHVNIIDLYRRLYGKRLPYFRVADYDNFKKLCNKLSTHDQVICRIVTDTSKKIVAAVVLIQDGNRLYNMISCITDEGKKLEANYHLYDHINNEFAGNSLILDLEGSDVKGIANFYHKMSPVPQPYPFIKYNNLPPLLKFFKK